MWWIAMLACSDAQVDLEPSDPRAFGEPTCPQSRRGFAACLVGGPPADGTTHYLEAGLHGLSGGRVEVVDAGDHLAAACRDGWGITRPPSSLVASEAMQWLQLEHDDGTLATLGVQSGFDLEQIEVGDEVTYDFASREYAFAPSVGHLELRDTSGELLVAMTEGGYLSDLVLPDELQVDRGSVTCAQPDYCLRSWQESALEVAVDDDASVLVPFDEASVGGWVVSHGGFREALGRTSRCSDAYVADVAVAIWAP